MTKHHKISDQRLHDALRYFGVNNSMLGYTDTFIGMKYIWENQDRMRNLSRYVYPMIYAATGRKVQAVITSIHGVACAAWENARHHLKQYDPSLNAPPTNSEFLEILLQYLDDHATSQR